MYLFYSESDVMFKDYHKYLSTSLNVYLFVLVIVIILKIVGLDYIGIDLNNPAMVRINEFCLKWKLDIIFSYINCLVYYMVIIKISNDEDSKSINKYILLTFPLVILFQYSKYLFNNTVYNVVFDLFYLFIFSLIYKGPRKDKIIRYWVIMGISFLFQIVSIIIRKAPFNTEDFNFITSFICNLDYMLLNIIAYKLFFMKGGKTCYQVVEASLSSLKKINLKKSLAKLQKNLQNSFDGFKRKNKEEKISIVIYIILSLIWNILSVVVILVVAMLNGTLVECIFILTSFWLSKYSFGKPFHLSSMLQCFIVSNLTYFALNKLTAPLGISIFIPVLLGVGLSYLTSKLVKKTYKPLYRGMPKDLFEETILKVTEKGSDKYNICYEFYIEKKSDLSLSYKYNYSIAGIRKIRDRINYKIKRL